MSPIDVFLIRYGHWLILACGLFLGYHIGAGFTRLHHGIHLEHGQWVQAKKD